MIAARIHKPHNRRARLAGLTVPIEETEDAAIMTSLV